MSQHDHMLGERNREKKKKKRALQSSLFGVKWTEMSAECHGIHRHHVRFILIYGPT